MAKSSKAGSGADVNQPTFGFAAGHDGASRVLKVQRSPRQMRLPFDPEVLPTAELERIAAELAAQLQPIKAELIKRRRLLAAREAAKADRPSRRVADPVAVRASWRKHGAGRDTAAKLAREFQCSLRTIHRILGPEPTRGEWPL